LRRFDQLTDQLAKHGVSLMALSKDGVADAAMQRRRDGLRFPLLSDESLEVIGQYGLEHHKAIEFSTGRLVILGVPIGLVPSFKTMAVPTTVLIDEAGTIRWIDQTDDYRLRSKEEHVMKAVREAFPL
jgi:peroxiredoxin